MMFKSLTKILLLLLVVSCSNEKPKAEQFTEPPNHQSDTNFRTEYSSDRKSKSEGVKIDDLKNGIWKTYDQNNELTQAAYYYQGKMISELNVSDFQLSKVESSNGKFSILLPESWLVQANYKQALFLAVKQLPNDDVFSPTITIITSEVPQDVSFNQVLAANISNIQSAVDSLIVVDETHTSISGTHAYELIYLTKTGTQKLGVLSMYYDLGSYYYNVTCIAEGQGTEFVKYKDLFKEITRSARFL